MIFRSRSLSEHAFFLCRQLYHIPRDCALCETAFRSPAWCRDPKHERKAEMQKTGVVNSPESGRKKREGKKRKSPCTPLREKGKPKEDRRGSLNEPSFACARGRNAGRHARLAAVASATVDSCLADHHQGFVPAKFPRVGNESTVRERTAPLQVRDHFLRSAPGGSGLNSGGSTAMIFASGKRYADSATAPNSQTVFGGTLGAAYPGAMAMRYPPSK